MKRIACLLWIVFIAISGLNAQEAPAKGIFAIPSTIEYSLNPGQIGTRTLKITNRMDSTRQFRLYLGDWERDSTGRHIYAKPGTKSFGCSNWIKLEKDFIEVKAGETVPVVVTIVVPDTAVSEMKWSMLFVEMVNENIVVPKPTIEGGRMQVVNQLFRIGVHLYYTPLTSLTKEVKFEKFEQQTGNTYRIACRNTGDIQVRCKSTLELTNLTTGVKTKAAAIEFPLFPKQRRVYDFKIPDDLPKGKYSFLVLIDAGEDLPIEAAQKEFEIK